MSTYVNTTTTATDYLNDVTTLHPDLSLTYISIADALSRKLYHQFTVQILSFVTNVSQNLRSSSEGANSFLALYDKVVLTVDSKLNQLTLARIASAVSNSLLLRTAEDVQPTVKDELAAKEVLQNLLEKDQLCDPAKLYVESKLHLLKLRLMESSGTMEKSSLKLTKEMIERNKSVLSELGEGTESGVGVVYAAYYECTMSYRKVVGPPESFYKEAVQYLYYTPIDALKESEKYNLAVDLSLATLTGEGVYNFGEVMYKNGDILSSLKGTDNEWLLRLINAGTYGNVDELDQIWKNHKDAIDSQPALVSRAETVREKITMMALVNMVFERPSSEWSLQFKDVAARVGIDIEHVEWIVMRALSLKLIGGSMDQVDGTIDVTWVMPRVLDEVQMKEMGDRFGEWAVKVSEIQEYMNEHMLMFD